MMVISPKLRSIIGFGSKTGVEESLENAKNSISKPSNILTFVWLTVVEFTWYNANASLISIIDNWVPETDKSSKSRGVRPRLGPSPVLLSFANAINK